MRVAGVILFLVVASCGGFLPFGDDDDEPAPPPPGDAGDAASDGASDAMGSTTVDGAGDAVAPVTCSQLRSACTFASDCCTGLECRAGACCVAGGQYANAAADCCSGTGDFEGVSGWRCLEER